VSTATGLGLRFLGEIDVSLGGRTLGLPPSRKTRALLAYLALTGRPHRRDRLCSLLWDVADDPRGALRWSLSRLRAVLDEPERQRIRSHGDSVAFDPQGAWVDVAVVRRRVSEGLRDTTSVEELREIAGLFRGELLEGLDLDDFGDFHAWCVAEREDARRLHAEVLSQLIERLRAAPHDALPHARALASIDPLDGRARAELLQLLLRSERQQEAEQQYESARRLLRELGRDTALAAVEDAWSRGRARHSTAAAAAPLDGSPAAGWQATSKPAESEALVGRDAELAWLDSLLASTLAGGRENVLLLVGEPGIGKSRLLAALCALARRRRATVLEGRSFEAEASRPYAAWAEALRGLPAAALGSQRADLAPVLPQLAAPAEGGSRERLFDAVAAVIASQTRDGGAVVLTFDDVQWLDPASAELMHYVARTSRERPLLLALTARDGELPDNEAASRLVRGLRQQRLLEQRRLEPLSATETAALVRAVAPAADAGHVFAESAGNPLFASELARSIALGDAPLPGSLVDLIRQRIERLPPEAGEVVRWASVVGRGFDLERLRALVALEIERLLAALECLERHGLLRSDAQREGAYAFTHEVVRRAVYGELSGPRRRLMHLRVARVLEAAGEAARERAAELAHHAAQAGETGLAASACVAAGRRSLQLFANEAAFAFARGGRRHADTLPEPERTERLLELLQVELAARRPAEPAAVAREVEALAARALDEGRPEHARLGYHLLAWLRWEQGDGTQAEQHTLRAELVSRAGSERDQVTAMAEAARCLALLERDLTRAEALALEARARAERTGVRPSAIADAEGMLRLHAGLAERAAELFEQARVQARSEGDRLAEFQALEHLVAVHQQRGAWDEAWGLCGELVALGEKLRGGSEAAFARALWALSLRAQGHAEAAPALEAAIAELRSADAKHRLAYALTRAAQLDLADGQPALARARAEEALRAADAVDRPTEALLAGVTLASACAAEGDREAARQLVRGLRGRSNQRAAAVARRALAQLLEAESP
jgi:DNA-binding SARP family transcriptional activator